MSFDPANLAPNTLVFFGRSRGEKTVGRIICVLPSGKYKVEQLEARGRHPVGTPWTVPASLLAEYTGPTPTQAPPAAPSNVIVQANPAGEAERGLPGGSKVTKRADDVILADIRRVYSNLSPENLTWDGERSHAKAEKAYAALVKQLRILFTEFGRPVSESEALRLGRA